MYFSAQRARNICLFWLFFHKITHFLGPRGPHVVPSVGLRARKNFFSFFPSPSFSSFSSYFFFSVIKVTSITHVTPVTPVTPVTNCKSLIKVKLTTGQFRPSLGSGCCRLSIVTMLKKTQNCPISDFFDLTPKYFLPLMPYTDLVPPSTDPVPPSSNQYRPTDPVPSWINHSPVDQMAF